MHASPQRKEAEDPAGGSCVVGPSRADRERLEAGTCLRETRDGPSLALATQAPQRALDQAVEAGESRLAAPYHPLWGTTSEARAEIVCRVLQSLPDVPVAGHGQPQRQAASVTLSRKGHRCPTSRRTSPPLRTTSGLSPIHAQGDEPLRVPVGRSDGA